MAEIPSEIERKSGNLLPYGMAVKKFVDTESELSYR